MPVNPNGTVTALLTLAPSVGKKTQTVAPSPEVDGPAVAIAGRPDRSS
jgi:hypothetical protein